MILRCYPNVSAIYMYFGDIPNLVSCAFSTISAFLLFPVVDNSIKVLITQLFRTFNTLYSLVYLLLIHSLALF